MTAILALVLGATLGTGVVLTLIACLRPAPLDVAAAWQQITLRENPTTPSVPAGSWRDQAVATLAARSAQCRHPWLALPEADLAVLDRTPTSYVTRRLASAAVGAIGAGAVAVLLALAGIALPPVVLTGLVLGAALLGALLPVFATREAAAHAREECRRSVAAYLDLVAQERATGHAPTQALREAAQVGDNWVFARLRSTLADATRAGHTPWHALRTLGERYAVVELCDVADIAATAADGAAIYTSLRTKAASLRTATVTSDKAKANAASERLSLPTSLLLVGFLLLVLYPTAIRLLTS